MKKLIQFYILLICSFPGFSQAKYYEGEWMRVNKTSHFLAVMKLEMNGSYVDGKIYWKFLAADSADADQVNFYSGKKYKVGIEYVKGDYNKGNSDLNINGTSEDDPLNVIGVDKYQMKFCPDWKVMYGKTWSNGLNDGLVYFKEISDEEGKKREEEYRKGMRN